MQIKLTIEALALEFMLLSPPKRKIYLSMLTAHGLHRIANTLAECERILEATTQQ